MIKILITGGSGFVASNIKNQISKQSCCKICCLSTKSNLQDYNQSYNWEDLEAIPWNEFDVIIHSAGLAHDTSNKWGAESYNEINSLLSQRLFDLFLKSSVKKFIFFSSVLAVTDFLGEDSLDEFVVPKPLTLFGKSKRKAEEYILNNMPTCDKQVYILRACMIHGPRNKGNLNLLYKIASKGFPWPLGAFENRRSFTSIQNLQYIINELIKRDVDSGIYNISDDETLSTNDIIKLIADSLGKKHRICNLPKKLFECIARGGDILKLPLNSERLRKLTESYVVSNAKIKKALSITKMPITAEDGMRYTLDSFKAKKIL